MFGEYGSGIRQVYGAFTNIGSRSPEYIKLPGRLIVRVYGSAGENLNVGSDCVNAGSDGENTDSDGETDLQKDIYANFSNREQKIIALIKKDNRILLNEIARKLTVSKRTILRDVKRMKEGKIIERIGSEKNGYWKVDSAFTKYG